MFRKLEFQLFPVNAYLNLEESVLDFKVDVPEHYVFDNYAAAKLFENCKLSVNHAVINNCTSEADFYMAHLTDKLVNYEVGTLKKIGGLQGIWSTHHYGTDILAGDSDEIKRRQANSFEATKTVGERTVKYRRYHFIFPLDLILSQSPRPLPKNAIITITLARAPSRKSLITPQLDSEGVYDAGGHDETPLELIQPTFRAKYFESEHFDRRHPKDIPCILPFVEKSVRRGTGRRSGQL